MFERFTDRARKVVVLAQEESRALNHDYIGTEHILLALMNLEGSVSCTVLTNYGHSTETLRSHLDAGDITPNGHIPFTIPGKKVLELSLREALEYGHREIDDYHLLLGILRMHESTALSMLVPDGDGDTIFKVRQAILDSPQVTASNRAAQAEQTTKTALMAQIASRLEHKSEEELESLLASLS